MPPARKPAFITPNQIKIRRHAACTQARRKKGHTHTRRTAIQGTYETKDKFVTGGGREGERDRGAVLPDTGKKTKCRHVKGVRKVTTCGGGMWCFPPDTGTKMVRHEHTLIHTHPPTFRCSLVVAAVGSARSVGKLEQNPSPHELFAPRHSAERLQPGDANN